LFLLVYSIPYNIHDLTRKKAIKISQEHLPPSFINPPPSFINPPPSFLPTLTLERNSNNKLDRQSHQNLTEMSYLHTVHYVCGHNRTIELEDCSGTAHRRIDSGAPVTAYRKSHRVRRMIADNAGVLINRDGRMIGDGLIGIGIEMGLVLLRYRGRGIYRIYSSSPISILS
jgi:hypothetical protein